MMKKEIFITFVVLMSVFFWGLPPVSADDIELARKSTLEDILKRGELRVGFETGYMPFVFTDPSGTFIGIDMDIAKEMAKALGVKLTPVHMVWDNIFSALKAKSFDILIGGITITQQRNLTVNFADPYMIIGQTILLNKKH